MTRRFELGPRQCMVLGLYAAPNGQPAKTGEPLTEGSLRMDSVYCAAAGQSLSAEQAAAAAASLKRSEEHTSELQSLMRISYAVFCLKKKKNHQHSKTNK